MARHTRFAGSDEPLHIFQDDMYENVTPMTSHAPMPAVPSTRPNRRPLTSSSANVVFNPPNNPHANYSPFKSRSNSMGHAHAHTHAHAHAPLQSSHGNRLNMVPMAPPMAKGRATTDSLQKKPYLSNFKTIPQKMGMDMNFGYGKENVHPQIYPAPAALNLSVENFYQKPNGKRGLMEAAPIKKRVKMEHGIHSGLDSFPRIVDDGNKPPHSYAQLIGMAILRSPKKMLTLSQIYKWISDNYSFYSLSESGWQNSIRHNLSLHKNFIKIERPKEDPGKGNYWGIEPGTESQFLKEKPARKSAPTAENLPVMSTRLEPSRPTPVPMQEPTLPPPAPLCQAALPPLPTSQATMSMAPDISSDATIPISDNIGPEDALDKRIDNDILDSSLYSPLPAAMNSSPPVSRHINHRSNTPPPASHNMLSSAARSHKRKFASMDDSGYISSLESSVLRPNASTRIPTSEADRPRIKRGRAEEEIARLRGSSPYSPTKGRSMSLFSLGPVSSSPLRQAHEGLGLGLFPLTPTVKFKPPVRPPPSASPNTNLRLHRDKVRHMLQSPLRRVVGAEDAIPWSPAFNLDDTVYNLDCDVTNTGEFDIWHDLQGLDDNAFSSMSSADAGSPVKRSARRARLDRSASTSALGDITNLAPKKLTSVPLFKIPELPSTQFLETPSKAFEGLSSPAKLFEKSPIANQSPTKFTGSLLELPVDGDWPALMGDPADYISNDHTSVADFSGLDILQGFEKIGSGSQNPKPRGSKPGLGRSYSTAF